MTDKVQKIREEVARIQLYTQSEVLKQILDYIDGIDRVQEEPVSEFLNTESMIESYKQRLISQANGMKNSPLIDMCLVSYKHGINETLDTLNLSNVQRTVKNRKEPASEELKEAAIDYCGGNKGSDARKVAEIAREETIEEVCEWLKKNVTYIHPRKETIECVVNIARLKEDLNSH